MSSTTTFSVTEEEDSRDHSRTGMVMSNGGVSVTSSSTRSGNIRSHGKVATAMHNLHRKCEQLKEYGSYKKTELPEDIFEIFVEVSELGVKIGGTSQYNEYLRISQDVFSDQIPGDGTTVTDFFLGCDQSEASAGSRVGCEQRCAGNLPPVGYTAEHFCDTHTGVYAHSKLEITYSPEDRSDTIKIFHSKPGVSLSKTEIAKLKGLGVTNVILTYTGGDVNVKSRKTLMSLARPSVNGRQQPKTRSQASLCSRKDRAGDGGFGTGAWVIGAVIFFIFLILIIWLVVYAFRGDCATNPDPACNGSIWTSGAGNGNGNWGDKPMYGQQAGPQVPAQYQYQPTVTNFAPQTGGMVY